MEQSATEKARSFPCEWVSHCGYRLMELEIPIFDFFGIRKIFDGQQTIGNIHLDIDSFFHCLYKK